MSSQVTLVSEGAIPGNDLSLSPFTNVRNIGNCTEENEGNITWGDVRQQERTGMLRIAFWNCGGFPQTRSDGKNNMIRQWIGQYNLDIIGFSECNIHWPKLPITHRLRERTGGWFFFGISRRLAGFYCVSSRWCLSMEQR